VTNSPSPCDADGGGDAVSSALADLVESSDFAGLLRYVEAVVTAADWDELVAVRDRCEEAVTRGKQVWSVGQYAEYRLALDAPAPYAGPVVQEGAGRLALGPLWEVAASTHTWAELEPYLVPGRARTLVAAERALRGEPITSEVDAQLLDIPLTLAPWEPQYPVAEYRADGVAMPEDDEVDMEWVDLPADDPEIQLPEDEAAAGLLSVVSHWVEESSGRAEAAAVIGDGLQAIRRLGPHRVRCAEIDLGRAMAVMAWAGASGGARGRRRGTPVGRAAAWWALASLLGMDDDWPPDPSELGREAQSLQWLEWDPGERVGGWSFYLAATDPVDGLAWAVSAVDWR
jgi:hypothetical protein